ncbi:hypothetical protein CDAR_540231 [Caerostris darwini]|uniref:Uncharacterized protein n=1 Tax=Caerostris darwini TaxID=1538125 RepID=A0AAV4WUD3_9ARAC|nr:hypothetical protein CDAR_540231 [Caerostris darwini]
MHLRFGPSGWCKMGDRVIIKESKVGDSLQASSTLLFLYLHSLQHCAKFSKTPFGCFDVVIECDGGNSSFVGLSGRKLHFSLIKKRRRVKACNESI